MTSAAESLLPDEPSPAIAPEGRPIVAGFAAGAAVLSYIAIIGTFRVGLEWVGYAVAGVALVVAVWCAWFFRDPARRIPSTPGAVICPADGRVVMVGPAEPPAELGIDPAVASGMIRIAVFMNVFNVHVNRSPVAGVVRKVCYREGRFLNASLDKASVDNERLGLVVRMDSGREVASVQIAGLVARRIVCRVSEGTRLGPGQRYGLIRFGSRVDVYVPAGTRVLAKVGDKPVAGETVLAVLDAG